VIPSHRRAVPGGLLFACALVAAVGGAGAMLDRKMSQPAAPREPATQLAREFALHGSSPDVRRVATWVITSNDHAGHPFLIIDQARAQLFAFSGQGRLVGSTPVLRAAAWADPPAPSGRFVADGWRSARAGAMVWANAGRALSLREATAALSPRRLASAGERDIREADSDQHAGSFQVAGDFYRQHLRALQHQDSVAYVLPDTLPLRRETASYAAAGTTETRSFT
jgi:hypothetical protein